MASSQYNDNDARATGTTTGTTTGMTGPNDTDTTQTSNSSLFLEWDDTETLSLLLHGHANESEPAVQQRWSVWSERVRDDYTTTTTAAAAAGDGANVRTEDVLTRELQRRGFSSSYRLAATAREATTHNNNNNTDVMLPAALGTVEERNIHLEAVVSLLHVSPSMAVKFTMSSLLGGAALDASVASTTSDSRQKRRPAVITTAEPKPTQTATRVGSVESIMSVLQLFHTQRIARLHVMAELLRLEDADTARSIRNVLDTLDQRVVNENREPRGLFTLLLTAVMQPQATVQRDEVIPLLAVVETAMANANATASARTAARNQVLHQCLEVKRSFQEQEREVAMEALLVLLFHRLSLRRADLAILGTVLFQSRMTENDHTMTATTTSRFWKLCGLVFVEGMALWRVLASDDTIDGNDDNNENQQHRRNTSVTTRVDWKTRHSLLDNNGNTADTSRVEFELCVIETILREAVATMHQRDNSSSTESPEILALLAFGIFLQSTPMEGNTGSTSKDSSSGGDDVWCTLGSRGSAMVATANSDHDAFGYLEAVMTSLVRRTHWIAPRRRPVRLPLELQWFHPSVVADFRTAAVDDDSSSSEEIDAAQLAYASIGRELFVASIYVFQDTILPSHKLPNLVNVRRLSSLFSIITSQSPTLAKRFWSEWDVYNTSDSPGKDLLPLCRLLDAARRLAVRALEKCNQFEHDVVLQAIAPLFEIVAALSYDSSVAEEALLTIFPPGLIQAALTILQSSSAATTEPSNVQIECSAIVLASLNALSRVSSSSSTCRCILRAALEESDTANSICGPRILASIAATIGQMDCAKHAIMTVVDLLDGATLEWLLDVVRALKIMQTDESTYSGLLSGLEPAMVHLVAGVVDNLGKIVFDGKLREIVTVEVLFVIQDSVLATCDLLCESAVQGCFSLKSVVPIFECMSGYLQQLRPIVEFHSSSLVRDAALDCTNKIVYVLGTHKRIGETLCQFVTGPIAISMLFSLDVQHEQQDESMFLAGQSGALNVSRVHKLLQQRLSDAHSETINVETLRKHELLGRDEDEVAVLDGAACALRLLNWWAISLDQKNAAVDSNAVMSPPCPVHPRDFLSTSAALPPQVRLDSAQSALWSNTTFPLWACLPGYLIKSGSIVEFELVAEAFDYVLTSLSSMGDILQRESILRDIIDSNSWKNVMKHYMERMEELVMQEDFSPLETLEIQCGLRSIDLALLLVKEIPKLVYGHDSAALVKSMANVAVNVASSLSVVDTEKLNDSLTSRMRLATRCLSVLREFWSGWRFAMPSVDADGLNQALDGELPILSRIASCVLGSSMYRLFTDERNDVDLRCYGSFLAFSSAVVDVLSIELAWLQKSSKFQTSSTILCALEGALSGKLSGVVDTTHNFIALRNVPVLVSTFTALSQVIDAIPSMRMGTSDVEELLLAFSGSGNCRCRDKHHRCDATSWMKSFRGDLFPVTLSVTDPFSNLEVACFAASQEIRSVRAWTSFAQFLLPALTSWRHASPGLDMFVLSSANFQQSFVTSVAQVYRINVDLVDQSRAERTNLFFGNEYHMMACAVAGLLLTLFSREDWTLDTKDCIESMRVLSEVASKLCRFSCSDSLGLTSMKRVLTASVVLKGRLNRKVSFDAEVLARLKSIQLELTRTCCIVITALEHTMLEPIDSVECFCSCVSLLSAAVDSVVTTSPDRLEIDVMFSTQIFHEFKKFDLVRSLMTQAGRRSLSAYNDVAFLSTLQLFTNMATTDAPDFLSLLANNASVLFVSRQVKFQNEALESVSTSYDEERWLSQLGLVSACLLSGRDNTDMNDGIVEHLLPMAVTFIQDNRNIIMQCLAHWSSVEFGPSGSKQFTLTLNKLRETKLALRVVSELLKNDRAGFKDRCLDLPAEFTRQAASILVCLGSFLAACAASRFIFTALNQGEDLDSDIVGDEAPFSSLGPASRYFVGGVQNAKHEAIRFASHFVLNCSRAETQSEEQAKKVFSKRWALESRDKFEHDNFSMAFLENECRSSVTNKFAFQLELEAAESVYAAIQTLWVTHPASSSFVMYSETELTHFDSMHHVRLGTVIAFRERTHHSVSNAQLVIGRTRRTTPGLQIGTVVHSNTVRRQWRVRTNSRDEGFVDVDVDASQLAGIEDVERRVAMLIYEAAPDTASALESKKGPVSIGHLILVLRWCSQFFLEERDSLFPFETQSIIVRLAELTSAFLGLELAVREERGIQLQTSSTTTRKILADQVLDLFGETTELERTGSGFNGVRDGRLKNVLSASSWQGIRSQLQAYIDLAQFEQKAKKQRTNFMQRDVDGSRRSEGPTGGPFWTL